MKKLLYTLLAVSIIFSACDKDDDNTSDSGNNNNSGNTTATIIGLWERTSDYITYTYGYLHPTQGTEVVTSTTSESRNYPYNSETEFINFKSDGTYTSAYYFNGALNNTSTSNYYKLDNYLELITSTGEVRSIFTITTLTNSTLIIDGSSYESNGTWSEPVSWESADTIFFEYVVGSITFNKSNKKIDSSIQSQNKTSKTPFFKQFIDRRKE